MWMFVSSLKPETDFFSSTLFPFIHPPTFSNFVSVATKVPLAKYILNTFIAAFCIMLLKLMTSLLAAYGFSRFRFKYRDLIFFLCTITIFVPIQVTMIPNYLLIAKIGWLNTFPGLIAPQLVDAMGIFLLRQTIRSIPNSIFDSALVDGANHVQILLKILLPLIKPAFVALGVLFFINAWNEYYWPLLILNNKSMYTMPLALQIFASQEGGTQWGQMMAASVITALPPLIIYAFFQKYIISGFIKSNMKE
jgi:sn-glycerol 3-phosphate transport system permease protein